MSTVVFRVCNRIVFVSDIESGDVDRITIIGILRALILGLRIVESI